MTQHAPSAAVKPSGPVPPSAPVAPAVPVKPALRIDPAFAEAVVWRVLSRADVRTAGALDAYRRRSEPVYELTDHASRDAAFSELAIGEFERLGLAEPLQRAIRERPAVADRVRIILIGDARGRSEQGITWEPGGAHLGIRVDASRFVDPDGLLAWARHAFGHAEDTIDPAFGFRPGWEDTAEGRIASATQARLHRLWDVTVDARLAAAGRIAPGPTLRRHHSAIAGDLPGLGAGSVEAVMTLLWERPRPTFADLLRWAERPSELVRVAAPDEPERPRPDRCPLCMFPSDDVMPPGKAVATLVSGEYPAWREELGLCGRCTDRFRWLARLEEHP